MVALQVVTVIYMPIVLPLLLPGVKVEPLAIAKPLIVLMLIPLAIGFFIRARYERNRPRALRTLRHFLFRHHCRGAVNVGGPLLQSDLRHLGPKSHTLVP